MAIFRGVGGAGNATTDSEVTLLTQLEQSAVAAAASADASKTNAALSATSAATSATNAATSATNAANSATASATSATNSANSASSAATSATNAAADANLAKDWATKLVTTVDGVEFSSKHYAQQSGSSATAAADSAIAASDSASAASASATNATTSETNAANSASAASTSATNAANSATSASNSASAASTSATNAANSASSAATSATNAANSATSAAQSATDAAASAASIDTSNFVDLTSNQTVGGTKTFSNTIAGSINGNAATATQLQTARTIGGVSFNGTANIDLPGVNTAGNQNTSGSAASVSGTTTAAVQSSALATGTANNTTFLRGDRTWQSVPTPTIATTAEAQAGTNNTNVITPLRMREGFNASGSAPVFACRAWVNFDGTTSPGTIRASGNVSSVTRNGTGDYTVNFTTGMPDTNYCLSSWARKGGTTVRQNAVVSALSNYTKTTTQVQVDVTFHSDGGINNRLNSPEVGIAIFR